MSSEEIGNSGRLPAPPTGENVFESNSAETPPLGENDLFEAPSTGLAAEAPALNESALGNLSSAMVAPATGKTKREQTLAQKKVMANQNVQRQLLVKAGRKSPPVWVLGKLASLAAAGDPRYDNAFARAARGDPLKNIVTAKARGKKKGNTVVNVTTQKNSSLATSFMSPSPTANARANNGAAKNTIEGIEKMGAVACETIRSMVAASKTLCKELAKTNNTAGLSLAMNRVNALAPLPPSTKKQRKPRVAPKTGTKKGKVAVPSTIAEESEQGPFSTEAPLERESVQDAFSPPPGAANANSLSL
jgi:hypothetical protein